jgi:predicted house-cleaning NTP pyrophosphatase (Maf/HAM1 superfamily)
MENEIISKEIEAALKSFQAKNSKVPEGYFNQFEQDLMHKIHTQANAPKQAKLISLFAAQKKYLVAASLVFAVATGYLFYNKMESKNIVQDELVQIEALPDAVIEAYVNSNELVAEVDWNSAIETAGASISLNNN